MALTRLTKEQRKARDDLAKAHINCPSVEQFFGSRAESAPYGSLVLRFEEVRGGIPHVYLIDQEGKVTIMGVWP